ncbi:transcription factor TFIIIB component B'' homolog isoform X2 [Motacilla alba alba]|uniref:transcription factor TFIIIB component B'' homolog isoform X2 n=1 Tax=Motacilla alba alba TaxID=1094192 RepID=UPI0018D5209B|nr:transcription factor TFIIIB component B'' homolog isoform X2 [Motacilla alba alba]
MFRRARLTVRPNVRPPGRAAATGAGGVDPEPPEPPGPDTPAADGAGTAAESADARRAESDDKADNTSGAGGASKPAEMLTQRRKRISTMPNLVKPRAGPSSAQHSAPKPQRRTSQASDGSASLQKDPSPSEKSNAESSVKSPMLPEKKTPVPQVPQFSPLKKSANKEQTVGVAAQKNDDSLQKNVPSPLKERPTQERSRTQEEKLLLKPSPEKVKRTCSDRERILKARKLREMLKEELKKERMLKHRPPVIEGRSPPDRSKMTMRDLIYYLPENNPMKSSLVEEKRTERSSALSQMKDIFVRCLKNCRQEEKSIPDHEEEEEEEEENGEESQDGPLLVPRVKVAEDGSIILDEESLTVEVLRTKGPCVVEENDPIFERGSTTTYSSFRKSFYTKPWSNKETDMFFLAISMVGTDFSLIGRLFPHRARAEIKNKFKREEKTNGWRIDKAFREKRPFDFEFFAQLLEKVLADEGKRKQKTIKSQKPKEKKSSRPQKKSKAKAASTEAANDQDELQKAGISDAETEADGVTAEKENEESLGISEQAEEEVTLEPALAKKKRKRKRKDDLEREVENIPEEVPVPSKTAKERKSSNKRKKVIHDASSDGDTTCGEEVDCAIEGKQNETAVTEEERSEACSSVDKEMEREDGVNLCSVEDSNDVILEAEPAKLRTRDIGDGSSQESQIPESPVSNIRSKETECVESTESKCEGIHHSQKPDRKQSASECGSQSEIMKTEKSADRRRLQRPKPNLVRSSGRRDTATQDKMEAKTSSPTLANAGEKCSEEDSRRKHNDATEVENRDLDTASQEPEKAAIAKTIVRGYRQRFKPNVTRPSGRKEEPEKDAGSDKISHLQPKGGTEKNNDQVNGSDDTREDIAEKDDKVLETMSQSNETAGLREDSKRIVLNQTPLKRGRIQRPKPNLGRPVARQELIDEKDPEEETTEGREVEEGVTHHRDENNDPFLKSDLTVHEGIQPSSVTLEDVSADSEMNSNTRLCFQEKFSEAESNESEKGLSDVSKRVSDSSTGKSHPQKEEEKTVVSSAWLLRTQFQRPKPNLRTASRKEVLDENSKDASQKDTNKEESLTQCDSECSIPPDTDKAGKCQVLNTLESLGKEKSLCSQEVSERPSSKSPKTFSTSEDGELEFCLSEISQDDISTTIAGAQEEHQYAPLPPLQLARNKMYKPNLVRTVGKKELQISENESKKKPEAEQKDEFDNTVMGENEAVLCQADVLSKEEQEQQDVPQVFSISETLLSEQSSTEKLTSQEGKLSGLNPGQLVRIESSRARPNLERTYSKKGSPVVQKLTAPNEEEMNHGENLLVAEESENLLSSKDDMEVLLLVGNLAENDNLDVNSRSMTSGTLCSSKKSPNYNVKREEEECLSADAIGRIQDTTERSNDKLSSGEESEQRGREPHWNLRPDLMRLTRKRDYREECENREEDNTERNEEEFLVLLKTGVSGENSSSTVEAGSFSEATRKHSFVENVEETSHLRIRQDITLQSPGILSESERHVEQDNDSQLSTSQEKCSGNLTRRQFRRSSKQTALPEHVLEPKTATSVSECEADCSEKRSQRQEAKLSVTRDKSLKTTQRRKSGKEPRSSKITFVTLRASQEEEEEDEEADEFEFDDEDECFASEEVNKAPVFVPIGLRSPKPIPMQIQETVEELEISVNIPDVQVATDAESLTCASIQPVVQREEESTSTAETIIHENPDVDKGINDGSTEAAMTLLAMGDPNFQLKASTEEQTHMLRAQDDLDTAHSVVNHSCSKENRTSSQYLLASDTSVMELLPSEDVNNINVEHQSTGTRIGVEEYSEMDATDTSGNSLPMVNTMRLTGGGHLEPKPTSAILRSSENIMPEILSANVLVEQLEQIQTDLTTLRGNAEMQKVEPEPIRQVAGDSSVLHVFASGSMELTKQVDKTERTEKQKRDACGNSGALRHLTASPKPEKSHLGLEDCPNPSSVDELSEQSLCPLEHHICTVNFTQNEACTQDARPHCISNTEETSVVNDDHRCPEEEQTFILTLVEIPAGSKEFDASAMVEQTSEPVLPAPILISPINASETTVTEVESIGSLTTAAGKVAGPLNSSMETKLESAVDSVPKLQTAQKRLAAELEENDFPPSKKTPSTVAVENDLETTYKGDSVKSTDVPVVTSGNPFQKTESSAKEKVLTSVLVSESISQLPERSQLENLESLGKSPLENAASEMEEEVMSRLTSNRRSEISGQGKQENVHESAQLKHTRSPASSSKTPLFRGGRKPLGFLSLICQKSNSESAEDTKGNRGKIQKPRIVTPKRSLKKPTPSTKDERESCSFPSTSSSVEHELVAADAAVTVPSNNSSVKPPLCAKDQEKEGEPTKISEYFFSDIFMEVDDSE